MIKDLIEEGSLDESTTREIINDVTGSTNPLTLSKQQFNSIIRKLEQHDETNDEEDVIDDVMSDEELDDLYKETLGKVSHMIYLYFDWQSIYFIIEIINFLTSIFSLFKRNCC